MIIAGEYSFKNGKAVIENRFFNELQEIKEVIAAVDSEACKVKVSKEKTMPGRMLYRPGSLNDEFKAAFHGRQWYSHKVNCTYSTAYYTTHYMSPPSSRGAYREMDFVKDRLGIEVQFGKYAFMVYNVCAKMTIFNKMDIIDAGVEIVPVKSFADEMSTGVSYFEQFVWDLEHRGVADIDIPVLILGVAA
jgi:hypothetical protein